MEEDKIEEIIEKKVEEKLAEQQQETESSSEIEKLVEKKIEEKIGSSSNEEKDDDGKISRRKFLKTAGLGAGALAMSSMAGAWYSFGGSSSSSGDGFTYIQSSTPSGASEGDSWYDTSSNQVKAYDGSSWNRAGVTAHSNLSGISSDAHHPQLWTEDGNSPWSGTGDTITANLASRWDYLMLEFTVVKNSTSGNVNMRFNGDSTSNHRFWLVDGTETTGATEFQNVLRSGDNQTNRARIAITAKAGSYPQFRRIFADSYNFAGAEAGFNTNVGSDITSISLGTFSGGGTDLEWDVRVLGRNAP